MHIAVKSRLRRLLHSSGELRTTWNPPARLGNRFSRPSGSKSDVSLKQLAFGMAGLRIAALSDWAAHDKRASIKAGEI